MKNYAIGIDLGGTKTLFAVVDKNNGEIIKTVKMRIKNGLNNETVIDCLINGIDELIEKTSIPKAEIDLIGIGAAGQIDIKNGEIIFAPNLNCKNLCLKQILEEKYNIPTYVDNDVNVAALGELKFGSAKHCENAICVFVGTGVGSTIIINNKIFYGATSTAGEIGHTVIVPDGKACNCGKKGCLEAYASRTAIEKRIKEEILNGANSIITDLLDDINDKIRSSVIKEALHLNDKVTINALDEASYYLACSLASVINFLNPEKIILGGGLIESVDYFYQKTIETAKQLSLDTPANKISFEKTVLGDFSGVIGACFLND